MKKSEQRAVNSKVVHELEHYNGIIAQSEIKQIGRLHQCQAFVYETDFYFVLRSYNTVVAIIKKADMTLYDFSRYVYGYTATAASHIAKFAKDYNIDCESIYTWREVK